MRKSQFTTKVDRRSRKAMQDFLIEHYKYTDHYDRMYAHKVKIHNIALPDDDKAYDLIFDGYAYEFLTSETIAPWQEENPGFSVYFAGRNNGYLVLSKRGVANWNYEDTEGWSWDPYSIEDLRWETRIVQSFDELVQEVYEVFYAMCEEEDNHG